MINTSTVSFSGFAKRIDKPCEEFLVKGTMTKNKNNITSGSYELRSNKTKEFVKIPFTINGYIDENGFLNIETWTNTKIKGLLTRNVVILSGLNHQSIPIKWYITFQ
jgi:hypothetical protein